MPRKRAAAFTGDEEREGRAARKRLRTQWRTGATEKEKKAAINLAVGRLGGKKYSWMDQAGSTSATGANNPTAASQGETTITSTAKSVNNDADNDAEEEFEDDLEKEIEQELEKSFEEEPEMSLEEELEKELEKGLEEQLEDADKHAGECTTASAVKESEDVNESHLPSPEASSSPRPIASEKQVCQKSPPKSPLPIEQPGNQHAKKRKRGSKEDPIAVSSREASPIVISSRDGTPNATPEPPKAKKARKAKKTPETPESLVAVDPLEEEIEELFEEEEEKDELYLILDYAWAFMTI